MRTKMIVVYALSALLFLTVGHGNWITGNDERSDVSETFVASVLTCMGKSDVPQVVFGHGKHPKVRLTIYSAATCTHCASYHTTELPQLMKLVNSGDLQLVLRTFVAHAPWDLIAAKISWIHGAKKQHEYFSKILANQEYWLTPAAYDAHNDGQKADFINKLNLELTQAAAQLGLSVKEIKAKLLISEDDPAGFLKLLAVTTMGLNIHEVQKILEDSDLERKILLCTLDARDGDKVVNFTPAMYIETKPFGKGLGTLQTHNVTSEEIKKMIDDQQKAK